MSERGGARPGAGRKKGTMSDRRKTVLNERKRLEDALTAKRATPLEIMARVMAGDATVTEMQFEAAKAAAPYIHPKLSAVQMNATVRKSFADMSDEELAALTADGDSEG